MQPTLADETLPTVPFSMERGSALLSRFFLPSVPPPRAPQCIEKEGDVRVASWSVNYFSGYATMMFPV